MLQYLRDSLYSYPCRWLLNWSPFVHAAARHSCCIVPKLSWVHGHQFHETMGATPSFSVYVHNQGTVLACLLYLRFLAQQLLTKRIPNIRPKTRKQILCHFKSLFLSSSKSDSCTYATYNTVSCTYCTVQYHVCIV